MANEVVEFDPSYHRQPLLDVVPATDPDRVTAEALAIPAPSVAVPPVVPAELLKLVPISHRTSSAAERPDAPSQTKVPPKEKIFLIPFMAWGKNLIFNTLH